MIIDPHVHVGHDTTFDSNRSEKEVIGKMDEVGINIAIVQPAQFVTFDAYHDGHNRIHRFAQDYPGRIYGMFSMNPHFDIDMYKNEARRCVEELGFVAMKCTPLTHILNTDVKRGDLPFETANELGVTLMFHLGTGLPFALGSKLFYMAKKYPNLQIVIAHSGAFDTADECLFIAKQCPNVYLECSVRTPNRENVIRYVEELGSNRVMYASDSPDEMAHGVWMMRHSGFTKEQEEDVLWRTAAKAFRLPIKEGVETHEE